MKMRGAVALVVVAGMVVGSLVAGCAQQAKSASEAIEHAKTLATPQAQADYLVGQARAFMNSKEYQEATQAVQYVLSSIDANSKAAAELLEQIQQKLAGGAQKAVGDAKKQLGF